MAKVGVRHLGRDRTNVLFCSVHLCTGEEHEGVLAAELEDDGRERLRRLRHHLFELNCGHVAKVGVRHLGRDRTSVFFGHHLHHLFEINCGHMAKVGVRHLGRD